MKKTELFLAAVIGLMFTAPAFAGEMKPSYANKKNGQVAFVSKEEKSSEEAAASAQEIDPSKVEPAAGVEEQPVAEDKQESLADQIKLPRKN